MCAWQDRRSLDRVHDRLAHCLTYLEAAQQAAAEALTVTAALRLGLDNDEKEER
jgi:hypothetical protein